MNEKQKLSWKVNCVCIAGITICIIFGLIFHGTDASANGETDFPRKGVVFGVREQVMGLQRRVGCTRIDGKIGPETTTLVNDAVRKEEKELSNQFTQQFFTETGAPNKISQKKLDRLQ